MCEPAHDVVRDVILRRRSVRSYEPHPLADAVLAEILEAAHCAPSAANRQPWHFVVVREPEQRRSLAEACNGQMWLADAAALIVGLGLPAVSEKWYRVDVAIALENLVIAAASHGLGTCWIGAFNREALKKLLQIPEDHDPIVLTPLGFPSGTRPFHSAASRKPVSEVACSERFGQPFTEP